MAVYTEVGFADAARLIARLGLGRLTSLHGIEGGIENTNYFVDTDTGRFVLTIFERLGREQLPFYLLLMQHLARHGLPVPEPKADGAGDILHTLAGKPAAVVDRLAGRSHLAPDAAHCAQTGAVLARLHEAVADFPLSQPNLRGLDWWIETAPLVRPHLDAPQHELLDAELAFQQQLAASPAYAALPRGPVHADLFRDNVMFDVDASGADRLTGLFDFYFAGVDTFAYDLAVCLNDWCTDVESGRLSEDRAVAFTDAYAAVRPLAGAERRLLPAMMRAAALRFWLSRLRDLYLPRDAALLTPHDPARFERVLRHCVDEPWHAAASGIAAPRTADTAP